MEVAKIKPLSSTAMEVYSVGTAWAMFSRCSWVATERQRMSQKSRCTSGAPIKPINAPFSSSCSSPWLIPRAVTYIRPAGSTTSLDGA